jgi:hypothetical protein
MTDDGYLDPLYKLLSDMSRANHQLQSEPRVHDMRPDSHIAYLIRDLGDKAHTLLVHTQRLYQSSVDAHIAATMDDPTTVTVVRGADGTVSAQGAGCIDGGGSQV